MTLAETSYLVSLVLGALPDPSSVTAADAVAALEMYGRDVDALALTPSTMPWGVVRWESGQRYWAEGVALVDAAGATLSPVAENLAAGWWEFPQDGPGAVYASGRVYRPWAAAAWLIERTVAALTGDAFDFSLGGDRVELSTRYRDWLSLAERLRARDREETPPESIPLDGAEWLE